jgi:hypothetical protein
MAAFSLPPSARPPVPVARRADHHRRQQRTRPYSRNRARASIAWVLEPVTRTRTASRPLFRDRVPSPSMIPSHPSRPSYLRAMGGAQCDGVSVCDMQGSRIPAS